MSPSPDWNRRDQGGADDPEETTETNEGPATLTGRFEEEQELLRRHIRVLKVVRENEPVGIIKLSELTDEPQHKVRYSLRVLEEEGLIEPTSMGAKTTDLLSEFVPKLDEIIASMQDTVAELKQVA